MKKTEIEKIVEKIKDDDKTSVISGLERIIYDREQKNSMYFWKNDHGSKSSRRSQEKWLNRDYDVHVCEGVTFHYWRDVSMSRKNVYAQDDLTLKETGDKVTLGDINKILSKL